MIFISIACKQVDVNKFGKWKHIKMKHFVKIVIKSLIGWSVQHYGTCYCCVTTLCSTVTTFTHFTPVFYFHTPWKLQAFLTFSNVFRGYRNETLAWNWPIIQIRKNLHWYYLCFSIHILNAFKEICQNSMPEIIYVLFFIISSTEVPEIWIKNCRHISLLILSKFKEFITSTLREIMMILGGMEVN